MVLEFTYVYEDYAEANAAHLASSGTGRPKARLLGWVLFIGLTVVLLMLVSSRNTAAPMPGATGGGPTVAPRPMPPATVFTARLLLPLVPWLLIFAFIWLFVFRQLRAVNKTPTSSLYAPGSGRPESAVNPAIGLGAQRTFAWVVIVAAVGAAVVLVFLNNGGSGPGPASRPGPWGFLLPVAPWFLVVLAILVMVRRGGLGVRRLWQEQPTLQRPKRIDVSDEGLVVSDAVTRLEHRWPAFTHVRETRSLFLLYVSNYGFQMVPKRAFASAAEADEFREIVRRMIAERPAPAFPVLPAARP